MEQSVPVQLGVLERIASIAEWPLLVIRRATVPIVEQEFYSRPWFLTSLVCTRPPPEELP